MPKKTTLLVIGIALVTLLLIFLAFRSSRDGLPLIPSQQEQEAQSAMLYFEEQQIVADPGEQVTANIMVDTGGKKITGSTIILDYDPEAVTIDSIIAPQENILGSSEADYIELPSYPPQDPSTITPGRAIFGIGETLNPQTTKPKEGIDTIATVLLTVSPDFSGNTQIEIFHDPNVSETSVVTEPGTVDSILKSTSPLSIQVVQ